jgi:putative protease
MPELLAPAGDLEKLEWAMAYGADAVYFGMKDFSLRSYAGNFTLDDAKKGIKLLHSKGRKAYITLNIYQYSEEYDDLVGLEKELEKINADAFIISDLGLIAELLRAGVKTPLHISTQANTMSYQTALFYKSLGVKRVNLARELSLERIRSIQKNLNGKIETEVFIHGAVCFSYSGRCAISDYMTGRKANRGECTHPCRWNYHLMEETRVGEFYPVFEDNRGIYLFNSKDLALFSFVPDLIKAGVESFKIEGRMKTIHYIASVVSLYRRIMDGEKVSLEEGFSLLSRVSNRGYSYGFMKGNITADDYSQSENKNSSNSVFVANQVKRENLIIKNENPDVFKKGTLFRVRNKIQAGDILEVLSPDGSVKDIKVPDEILKVDGSISSIVQNEDEIILPYELADYSILRKVNKK